MFARKKVEHPPSTCDTNLHDRIEQLSLPEKDKKRLFKDIHLIEAALSSDKIIVSRDDRTRSLLLTISTELKKVKQLKWINPTQNDESILYELQ